jgi:hypothetical protein
VWPLALALGFVFTLLNIFELAFSDGGWPQLVGVALGITLVAVAIARLRGWTWVGR